MISRIILFIGGYNNFSIQIRIYNNWNRNYNNQMDFIKKNLTLLGVAIIGVGGFLFVRLFYSKKLLTDEDYNKIKEIKEQCEDNLTEEEAIKLLALINRKTDEYMATEYKELDTKRRQAYKKSDNANNYEKICEEILDRRNEVYNNMSDAVLSEFGIDHEQLGELLKGKKPIEIEKLMFSEEKVSVEGANINEHKIKQAFLHYANMCIEQMKEFKRIMNRQMNNSQQEVVLYKLMIMKYKIDDDLFEKFEINENQLRFLLHENNMYNDVEIKKKSDEMARYEELLDSDVSG